MTKKQKYTLARIIAAAVTFIVLMLFAAKGTLKLILFLVPYLIIGYDVLYGAVRNLIRGQMLDEKFLMSAATIGAIALGDYPEALVVMLLYQIGELFQDVAVGKSRKSIARLMNIRPDYADVIRSDTEFRVEPDEVKKDEIIIVRPGERIPLDGVITDGETTVDASALTGESAPINARAGDTVFSGCVNLGGVVKIRVTGEYGESTVSKILELVENSADKKAKTENFITKFARIYTPAVVICALLLAIVPPIVIGGEWSNWINRGLIFLVVSCPCALVISIPLTFFGGIGAASSRGILIKGSNYMESLSRLSCVVFDKTGTLTKGVFEVTAVHPSELDEEKILEYAAYAESNSTHPIARSVCSKYEKEIDKSRIGAVREIPGKGITAVVDSKTVYVGNAKLMEEAGADFHECHKSGTVIHVALDGIYAGHIVISDIIKENSAAAIAELANQGITKTVMLTGDRKDVAQSVAEQVGVGEVFSELLPGDKVDKVEKLLSEKQDKETLAFVGDGINDAPVLARADVGIAMGGLGSDAAIEAADVVLMDDDPMKISLAIGIAKNTIKIAGQNIVFALAVKFAVLLLSAFGAANMWLAVFADVGVSVIAILNAMRVMRINQQK